jgi:tetratricopeptide (TPR) repeat protein
VPNLILIADVLINEELYDLAMGYLQKACDLDRYNSQISILMAKILYYQRKYEQAVNMFYKLQQDNSMIEESYKYLFVCSLIQNSKDAVNILKNIQQKTDSLTYKVYSQFYNVYMGRNEIIFVEQDDHEKILHTAMDILKEVLRVREFQLFEKLLGILNCMDSNKVLLELGKLYYDNGFKQMAVKEILRSIRELNVIDPAGVRILFKEIG